jgi:hypothetical protein
MEVDALLDSGATGLFINRALVQKKGIHTRQLEHPITVYNIDGSINRGGSIMEEVTLIMSHQGHQEQTVFEVCDLGKTDLIIGYPWYIQTPTRSTQIRQDQSSSLTLTY